LPAKRGVNYEPTSAGTGEQRLLFDRREIRQKKMYVFGLVDG